MFEDLLSSIFSNLQEQLTTLVSDIEGKIDSLQSLDDLLQLRDDLTQIAENVQIEQFLSQNDIFNEFVDRAQTELFTHANDAIKKFQEEFSSEINSIIGDAFSDIGGLLNITDIFNEVIDLSQSSEILGFLEEAGGEVSKITNVFGSVFSPSTVISGLSSYYWDAASQYRMNIMENGLNVFNTAEDLIAANLESQLGFNDSRYGFRPFSSDTRPPIKFPVFPSESDVPRIARGEKSLFEPGGLVYYMNSIKDNVLREPAYDSKPKYPHNKVKETPSGHLQEIDDTPGHERITNTHRTGTGYHYLPNGDQKTMVMGNGYSVLLNDNKIHVYGNAEIYVNSSANISVGDDANITVGSDCNLSVDNNLNMDIGNNLKCNIGKNAVFSVGEDLMINTGGSTVMNATETFMTTAKNTFNISEEQHKISTQQRFLVGSAETISMTAPERIDLNSANNNVAPDTKPAYTVHQPSLIPIHSLDEHPLQRSDLDSEGYPAEGNSRLGSSGYKKKIEDGGMTTDQVASANDIITPARKDDSVSTPGSPPADAVIQVPGDFNPNNKNDPFYRTRISQYVYLMDVTTSAIVSKYRLSGDIQTLVNNLATLARTAIDPIVKEFGGLSFRTMSRPGGNILLTSAYRQGTGTSWHLRGCAVDLQFSNLKKSEYFDAAVRISQIVSGYDHILLEYKNTGTRLPWIHVGVVPGQARGLKQTYFNHSKSNGEAFVDLSHL